jgi:hypothetical protein
MDKFFCADHSRNLGESPIGTAPPVKTYVLIECPSPWTAQASHSPAMPSRLGQVMGRISQQHPSVRFLLVSRAMTQLLGCRAVIVYRQKGEIFCDGYDRFELPVQGLEQAAEAIAQFFEAPVRQTPTPTSLQDVLICIHGSRDQCCARYGKPLFAAAQKYFQGEYSQGEYSQGKYCPADSQVQIWGSSHIGGHRFAPTAITFPDGRYYARLTLEGLQSILLRQAGALLRPMYRGWGILPAPLQGVEQHLLEQMGDRWFQVAIRYEVLTSDATRTKALITWMDRGEITSCYCEVAIEAGISLRDSCNSTQPSTHDQYSIVHLELRPFKQPTLA